MSYEREGSGIFDQPLFGFGNYDGGLGAVVSIVNAPTGTYSAGVLYLQQDLQRLGLLPAGSAGADGKFGPNTMNALGTAARALHYAGEVNYTVNPTTRRVTVPDDLLQLIHNAALTGKLPTASLPVPPSPAQTTPPPYSTEGEGPEGGSFDKTGLVRPPDAVPPGPGILPGGATPSSSQSGPPKWLPYAIVGGGVVIGGGIVYAATRKKKSATTAAKNPRRRRHTKRRSRR